MTFPLSVYKKAGRGAGALTVSSETHAGDSRVYFLHGGLLSLEIKSNFSLASEAPDNGMAVNYTQN